MLPFTIKIHKNRVLKRILIWSVSVLLGILYLFSFQYYGTEVFYKERNVPFRGESFYNPYKDFSAVSIKSNFHTHSEGKLGLTSGHQKPEEIFAHYKDAGYDRISLSDYGRIETDKSDHEYIPVYEHGYNIQKTHQLVINSERVNWSEFSLFQNYHTKQHIINKLKQSGGLVALAHPGLMHGYTHDDMKYLKGYDFIEVLNNYYVSDKIWDTALSNGYPAWILAGDDCHDISKSNLSFVNWVRIGSKENSRKEVLDAIKRGCYYGYRNPDHEETNFLDSCIVQGDVINVFFRKIAGEISFISDNGNIKKVIDSAASASYSIVKDDSYVRIEAKTSDGTIYLNPVIRFNGYQLNSNNGLASVNTSLTIMFRIIVLIVNMGLLIAIMMLHRRFTLPVNLIKSIAESIDRGTLKPGMNRI